MDTFYILFILVLCICVFYGFSVNQGNLKVNEPARRGLKPLHSISSLDGKFRFQNLILELLKLFTVFNTSTL